MSDQFTGLWHELAKLEFPGAEIIGDGPFALAPCFPKAKAFLFWGRADAVKAMGSLRCCPFCAGKHRVIILRQPKPKATAHRSPSEIERD